MATTKIYGRQIYSVNTGTAIGSGGANRVLYQDGSQNLASSTRFQFDGSHLSLIDATAATSGAPSVLSPYLNLNGRRWNGSADTASSMRVSNTPVNVGASNYIPSFSVDANAGSGWINFFRVGAIPDGVGGFGAYLKLRNPEVEGWGGTITVQYDGVWEFRNTADAKAGLSPGYIAWSGNSAWKNLEAFDGGYGTRINTYFGGDVVLHGNSNQLDTWFKYDDSNHVSLSVNSSGTATFNATGTTPKFVFSDKINVEYANFSTPNNSSIFVGGTPHASFTAVSTTVFGISAGQGAATGQDSTYIGSNAGAVATGSFNTAVGSLAAYQLTTGVENVVIGLAAGSAMGNASQNTLVGSRCGQSVTGNNNVGLGYAALGTLAGGANNASLGSLSGASLTTGGANTFVGYRTGIAVSSNSGNTFIGSEAGVSATGSNNTMVGAGSGNNTTGSGNVFLGYHSGYTETGSNKLYIANNNSGYLIYGEFDNRVLYLNTLTLRQYYDGSNYTTRTIGSSGIVTSDIVGTAPRFDFNKSVKLNPASGNGHVTLDAATNSGIVIQSDTTSGYYPYFHMNGVSGSNTISGYYGFRFGVPTGSAYDFAINSVSKLFIDTTNSQFATKVGIGASPSYSLHVYGDTIFGNGNGSSHLPYTDGDIYLSAPEIYFRDGSNSIHTYLSSTGLGIGMTSSPSAKLQVVSTTEQLRLNYDGSNLVKATVGSTGLVTWDGSGSGVGFRFDQKVERKINTSTGYAKVGGLLFHHLTDATTSGQAYTDLYTYSLAANTFSNNGDTVVAEYSGSFAANTNGKLVFIRIAGVDVADIDASAENGTEFNVKVTATRVSSSVLRTTVAWSYGTSSKGEYAEVTSLTFSNAYDIILRVRTPDQAGDITARFGVGYWYPGT